MYIVLRAGGVGTRLWPVSRSQRPKQLHPLTGAKTLLQEAVDRALELESVERIFVSCNHTTENFIRTSIPSLAKDNIIVEPALRDTAAAVALESIIIAQRNPEAIIASLGSDHVIADTIEFNRVLRLAEQAIIKHPDHIVCIGVKPTAPDIGYGYIELGNELQPEVLQVQSFREKPDKVTAEKFLNAGNYLWNANMFVWRADTVLNLFKEHQPAMYAQLMHIQSNMDQLHELYPQLAKIAIDYAIIEKTKNILAIPGKFGWNDIGDWARLKDELSDDPTANYSKGDHLDLDSKDVMVYSTTDRTIATIGLNHMIIVDTGDALLICDKNRSQDVKRIVDRLKKNKRYDRL